MMTSQLTAGGYRSPSGRKTKHLSRKNRNTESALQDVCVICVQKNPKMASVWLVHAMNRSAANLPPLMLPQIVVLVLMCLIRGDGWKIAVLHHISDSVMVNQGRFLWFKLIIVLWPADTVESSAIMISPRTHLRRITSCPSAGPPTRRHTATTTTLAWRCHTTGWLAPIRPTDKHVS